MSNTFRIPPFLIRVLLMLIACLSAVGLMALVGIIFFPEASAPTPVRSPFGIGMRETAGSVSGISAQLLAWQSQFYRALTQMLGKLSETGGMITFLSLSFAYGVFHAAGPGHGKAVIAAYIVASENQYKRGVMLSSAAAMLQACVAIIIVGLLALILNQTSQQITHSTHIIEKVSYAIMALVGSWVLWRRTIVWTKAPSDSLHVCTDQCTHGADVMTQALVKRSPVETFSIIIAAGIRPCMGAIVVLVFALSQNLFIVGVIATFAMAFGTALTTSLLAALAVFAKSLALNLAEKRTSKLFTVVMRSAELLAAAFIVVLGLSLFWQR